MKLKRDFYAVVGLMAIAVGKRALRRKVRRVLQRA
jgi:hypothetical protein